MKHNNAKNLFVCCSVLVLLFSLLTGGCMQLRPQAEQAPAIYLLEANFSSPSIKQEPTAAPVAVVAVPTAAPGYDTEQIAYMRTTSHLEYYAKSRWADAPAHMIAPLLVKALEQSGSFRAVAAAPTPARSDYLVNFELIRLLQEFTDSGSRMRLTCRVEVIDRNGILMASKVFDGTEPAVSQDAVGGVLAANRLLDRLLPEIASFCAAQVAVTK